MSDPILEALNLLVSTGMIRGSLSMNGRKVRWVETANGEPTVVLEAGRNDFSLSWARVIALLAQEHVHVVAYDRAGIGSSDPAPGEAILRRQVADLAAIIKHAAQGRCLLVGHSWGGVLAQLLAFEHPELVSGLVLVDPAHEEMTNTLPVFIQGMLRAFPRRLRPVLSALGIMGLIHNHAARQNALRFTEDLHTRHLVIHTYHSYAGQPDELFGAASDSSLLQQLRAASHPFPDIPVIILSASQGFPRRVREHWTALQANLAALASQGKHLVVANVDHAIPQKRPDAVVDAICEILVPQRLDQDIH
ncbi:MAG TPA: alpha/beta hydrolase [Ktedonobacteraceae bacterium]